MTEIRRRTPAQMLRYFANQAVEMANRSGDVELGRLGMAMNMSADSLDAEGYRTEDQSYRWARHEKPEGKTITESSLTPGGPADLILDVVEDEDGYRVYLVGIFPPKTSDPALTFSGHPAVRHRIGTFYGAKMDQQVLGLGKEGMQ